VPNPHITPELASSTIGGFFPGDLGIEFDEVTDELVRAHMAVDRRHLHPGGYVHGGAWVALADTVAAWGTWRHLEEGREFTTAELKVNVFAAARDGDVLEAEGEPLHIGRSTQVWEVRVKLRGKLAALFVCTQLVLRPQ
jgi:uncharacterized protein (TIGR00369 family)